MLHNYLLNKEEGHKTIKKNSKFNVEMNNSFYDPKISINKNHLQVVFSVELRKKTVVA